MKITVALGGNALLTSNQRGTAEEQYQNIAVACRQLIQLIKEHDLVITHGNGPQVGKIHLQNELSRSKTPSMPLDVCGAMSQGQIGYMIQQQLNNELIRNNINRPVVTVITQVIVDKNDPSFKNPTKPIGSFYSKEEALKIAAEKNEVWVEDSGRGWRKVVPSPFPLEIFEGRTIKKLVDSSCLVIASGGGGIPVIKEPDGTIRGVEAVIDKDLAGERLAEIVGAEVFLMLTDVPRVFLRYGKPDQEELQTVTVKEMEKYIQQGHFAAGSMGPKVEAAVRFVQKPERRAIITSLEQAVSAIGGTAGTQILP